MNKEVGKKSSAACIIFQQEESTSLNIFIPLCNASKNAGDYCEISLLILRELNLLQPGVAYQYPQGV